MDADNISKHIPNKAVKMYMIISAMGIVLVFESANHIDSTSISPLWNGDYIIYGINIVYVIFRDILCFAFGIRGILAYASILELPLKNREDFLII